jgi:competence protein ComEC
MKIENYPIVKVLLPYIVGIVVAYFGDFPDTVCKALWCGAGGCFLLTVAMTFVKAYRWRVVQTVVMNLAFVMTGISLTNWHFHSHFETDSLESRHDWLVRVAAEPTPRERSVKVEAEVLQNADGMPVNGKILLYLQPTATTENLRYGDQLFVHTDLTRIAPPCNPDAFDNQRYMRRRGIYYSGFVRDGAWECVGHRPANQLKSLAQQARNRLTYTYIHAGMSGDELDILKAILLGDDDTLDPELKASYSSAGVSHILCVSGMHVGIIFMIVNFLLKPLDLFRTSRIVKTMLVMLVVWLYAHITGLAPSVTRSATMFTFVAIGQLLQRNTNVFHSLFASAFILLVVNPLLLFEVGFQLSYLAVAGIVLFQPKLSAIYHCRTRIGNYLWELLTVSVAAQLGTSPISIYYFAQFPNYFMLSNLGVIALSFAVIITGVALLPISFIPLISKHLTWLLTAEIKAMNTIITFIEKLPHSVTENIDYHILQVLLLYGVIGCVCYMLYQRNRKVFWVTSVMFTLFCSSFVVKKLLLARETEFLAYHIRKSSALEFNFHGQAVLFADSIHSEDDKLFQYNVRNHLWRHHIRPPVVPLDTAAYDTPFLCKRGNLIRFNDRTYWILTRDQRTVPNVADDAFAVDCLLLRQNPRLPPDEVLAKIPFREVLADGSNTPFYIERWRVFCIEKGIPFTFTGDRKF